MTANILNQQAALHDSDESHSNITSARIRIRATASKIAGVLKRHSKFVGPGVVASVSFYDPGNWATDLQAGSKFGNSHLFVLFCAISMAVLLQVLACRLGFISGKDLAQNCSSVFRSQKKHTKLWKCLGLYPLWVILEIGVMFADLGELLGSAIAYNLLIPKIPIWGCILLSFPDVFLALVFFKKGKRSTRSLQLFEIAISVVVMSVVVSSLVLLFRVNPDWGLAIRGFLPSAKIVEGSASYTAIGMLGATIGPHAILLGSNLATVEREDDSQSEPETQRKASIQSQDSENFLYDMPPRTLDVRFNHVSINEEPEVMSRKFKVLKSCRSHLSHATFDIAASLYTLPLIINSAILIVASTSFFYTTNRKSIPGTKEASIESVHTLLNANLGPAIAGLFAFSLFLSGQAASLTITMAGQSLSTGFLGWETSALLRRLVTRTVGIVPSVIVAVLLGKKGINKMLIASQVAISLVLPFAIIPLVYFTSKTSIMTIKLPGKSPLIEPRITVATSPTFNPQFSKIDHSKKISGLGWFQHHSQKTPTLGKDVEVQDDGTSSSPNTHSFVNSLFTKLVAISVVCIVISANSYGIAEIVESYRIDLLK